MPICGYLCLSSSVLQSRLQGRHDQRPLRRVAVDPPDPLVLVKTRLVAQKPHAEAHGEMLALGFRFRDPVVEDLPPRLVAGPRQLEVPRPVEDDLDRHLVFREGPRLVRADDRRAPQGLDGRQFPQDRVACRHALHPDGQCDGQHDGQALGDRRHGCRHDGHEHLPDGLADRDADREESRGCRQHVQTDPVGKTGEFFLQGRPGRLRLPDLVGDAAQHRPGPGLDDDTRAPPVHDDGPHEGDVSLITRASDSPPESRRRISPPGRIPP